jgi:predicted enzyme related to lactoylglutathione lyase
MDYESLPPGTFSWPELSTTDQKSGVAFYRSLFGWDVNEQPMGPDETYSMFQMRGREVGAAYTMRPEERQHGVPPHWNNYVTVKNVDDSTKRAQELGGKVLMAPFDVMEAGRMAILQDPTGAVFQVWQPKNHIGTRIQREPGSLCWTELVTNDTQTAGKFYTQLFGWAAKAGGTGMDEYTEFSVEGTPDAGMMKIRPEWGPGIPAHWTPYFQVADCDATVSKAKSLGAQVGLAPTDLANVGRFAMLADPQGAKFAVFQPARA